MATDWTDEEVRREAPSPKEREEVPDVRPDDWPSGTPYPGEYAGIRGFLMELLAEVHRNRWNGDEPEFAEAFEDAVWLLSKYSLRTHSPEEPVGYVVTWGNALESQAVGTMEEARELLRRHEESFPILSPEAVIRPIGPPIDPEEERDEDG